MREGVIRYLMTCCRDVLQRTMVLFYSCVLTDHEERYLEIPLCQKSKYSRNEGVQVRRKPLPPWITMGLEIRPLIVEIQREAGNCLL